jgi:hypothetical protein
MIMKKSFPLLRAIGLSAGLVASAAMMAPAQAATSGSITATGTIPATCSVTGGSITMISNAANTYMAGLSSSLPISSTGTSTTFSLTAPVLTKPPGSTFNEGFGITGTIKVSGIPDRTITANPSTSGSSIIDGAFSGGVVFEARLSSMFPLTPGTYGLTSTLTCVTN